MYLHNMYMCVYMDTYMLVCTCMYAYVLCACMSRPMCMHFPR